MNGSEWVLPAGLVDVAFPFHVVLDRSLRIVGAGSSIRQLHDAPVVDELLLDLFEVVTPKVAHSFEEFAKSPRSLFLLRSVTKHDLVLRGQMMFDPDADHLIFIGSPWVTETATFPALGLTLDDFAVSDAVVDYVLLLQNQSTSLAQARELAERLRESAGLLVYQTLHDTLTGLPNRSMLLQHLQTRLDQPTAGTELAVLMLDLDGFKAVNDSLGHSAGDAVLETVGNRLRLIAGTGGIVARFGGDEFVLALEVPAATAIEITEAVATRVLHALREPVILPPSYGLSVPLSASVGISYQEPDGTAEELLRNADLAMYAAKAAGKSRIATFATEMHEASMTRIELVRQLRLAVERNEFRLAYQPILRLGGHRYAGAEALLRWEHPTRGMLAPDAFLAVAEETGLIVPIGAWVIDEACRELAIWQRDHTGREPLGVAVNLSGRQFGPELVTRVAQAIERHGIDPATLTLEITEGLITGDLAAASETVHALKALGVWLAIDDFGTGHSSLGRLREFEFDELKIDRQFVSDLDHGDATLVLTQIAMAHGLGLSVVAEGVETVAELDYLQMAGCDQVQGYLIARPLPPHEIRRCLAGRGEWNAVEAIGAESVHGADSLANGAGSLANFVNR